MPHDPALVEDTRAWLTKATKYAWKYRYPGEPEEPSSEEAESALALARQVFEAVLARLPQEVRP